MEEMIGKHSEVITGECNDGRDEGRFAYTFQDGVLYFEGSGKLSDDFDFYCFDDDSAIETRYYDLLSAKKIVIGEGCTAIGYGMFDIDRGWTGNDYDWYHPGIPCEAESILIPQGVTEIGERAFAGCIHVKQLMIPDSVVTIGRDAFLDVPHIFYHGPAQSDDNWGAKCWNRDEWKQITNETGIFYVANSGVLLRYERTPQNDIYDDGFRKIGALTLPEGVQNISDDMFRGYDIGWVKLPASLKRLGENVFSGSHIGGIKLPENPDPDMMYQLAHRLRFVHTWNADNLVDGWPQEYKDIYMGKSEPRERWQCIHNDSGNFWIDSDGVLMDFSPNIWFRPRNDTKILYDLNIPEGVTAIPSEMFQEYVIHMQITFPKSLRCIGVGCGRGSAFRYSWLPDLVLPENLEILGDYAFASTVIRSVTIPHDPKKILPLQARQFFGADIGELRVPVKYRHALQGNSWKDGHEMTDPVFGQLYCARHTYGYGAEVMAYLEAMRKMREGETE